VSQLAEEITHVLREAEPLGLPAKEIARRIRRRESIVRAELAADPRFRHSGARRGSRWTLSTPQRARGPLWDGILGADQTFYSPGPKATE
jgi:hypothetical protein